jgi:hypothetical protein
VTQSSYKPAAHPGTGFRLRLDKQSPILAELTAAGAILDEKNIKRLEMSLVTAVREFLDLRVNATSHQELRSGVKVLLQGIDKFLLALPSSESGLANALAMSARQLLPLRDLAFPDEPRSFDDPVEFEALSRDLKRLKMIAEYFADEVRVGKGGRTPSGPDHWFVARLAEIFEQTTGRKPKRGTSNPESARNGSRTSDHRSRAAGYFARFVKAVDDEIERQLVEKLVAQRICLTHHEARGVAKQYRLKGIDSLITANVEKIPP